MVFIPKIENNCQTQNENVTVLTFFSKERLFNASKFYRINITTKCEKYSVQVLYIMKRKSR